MNNNTNRQIQIKMNFTTNKLEFVSNYIQNYQQKIRRYNPTLAILDAKINLAHPLLQFENTPNLKIEAYNNFGIVVRMVHKLQPLSRIFFVGAFQDLDTLFGQTQLVTTPLYNLRTSIRSCSHLTQVTGAYIYLRFMVKKYKQKFFMSSSLHYT